MGHDITQYRKLKKVLQLVEAQKPSTDKEGFTAVPSRGRERQENQNIGRGDEVDTSLREDTEQARGEELNSREAREATVNLGIQSVEPTNEDHQDTSRVRETQFTAVSTMKNVQEATKEQQLVERNSLADNQLDVIRASTKPKQPIQLSNGFTILVGNEELPEAINEGVEQICVFKIELHRGFLFLCRMKIPLLFWVKE